MKRITLVTQALAIGAIAFSGGSLVSAQSIPAAKATLTSCTDGSFVGSATLLETPSPEGVKNVTILLSVQNLSPGKHAVHIHEVGACTPCGAAGSHLDLGPFGQNGPVTANHPFHSGDLVNVKVDSEGKGFMAHVSSRVALSTGNLSIFDADGASVVVHTLPDTYCPDPNDPNCAGGGRAACGVFQPIQ